MQGSRSEYFSLQNLTDAFGSGAASLTKLYTTAGEMCLVAFRTDAGETQRKTFEIQSVKDLWTGTDYGFPEPVTPANLGRSFLVKIKPANLNVIITEVTVNPGVRFTVQPPSMGPGQTPRGLSIFQLRHPRFDRMYLEYENILMGSRLGMNQRQNLKHRGSRAAEEKTVSNESPEPREFFMLNERKEVVILHDGLAPTKAMGANSQGDVRGLPGLDRVGRPSFMDLVDKEGLTIKPNDEIVVMWQTSPDTRHLGVVRNRYKMVKRQGDVILSKWQTEEEVRADNGQERVLIFYNSGELYQGNFSHAKRNGMGCHRVFKVAANLSDLEFQQKTLLYLNEAMRIWYSHVKAEHDDRIGHREGDFLLEDMGLAARRFGLSDVNNMVAEVSKHDFIRFFEAMEPWRPQTTGSAVANEEIRKLNDNILRKGAAMFPTPDKYVEVFVEACRMLIHDLRKESVEALEIDFLELRRRLTEKLETIQAREDPAKYETVLVRPLGKQLYDFLMLFVCWVNPENIMKCLDALFGLRLKGDASDEPTPHKQEPGPRPKSDLDAIAEVFKREEARMSSFLKAELQNIRVGEETKWRNVLVALVRTYPYLCARGLEPLHGSKAEETQESKHFLVHSMLRSFWNRNLFGEKTRDMEEWHRAALDIVESLRTRSVTWDSQKMAQLLRETRERVLSNSVLGLNQLEYLFLMAMNEQEMLQRELSREQDQYFQMPKSGGEGSELSEEESSGFADDILLKIGNKQEMEEYYASIRTETVMESIQDEFDQRGKEALMEDDPSIYEVLGDKKKRNVPVPKSMRKVEGGDTAKVLSGQKPTNKGRQPDPLTLREIILREADMDYGENFDAELSMALYLVALMRRSVQGIRENCPVERLKRWGAQDGQAPNPTNNCLEKDQHILKALLGFWHRLVKQSYDKLTIKQTQQTRLARVLDGIQKIKARILRKANTALADLTAGYLKGQLERMTERLEDVNALVNELDEAGEEDGLKGLQEGKGQEAEGKDALEWTHRTDIQTGVAEVMGKQLETALPSGLKSIEFSLRKWMEKCNKHPDKQPLIQKQASLAMRRMTSSGVSPGAFSELSPSPHQLKQDTSSELSGRIEALLKGLPADQLRFVCRKMAERYTEEALASLQQTFKDEISSLTNLRHAVLGSVNFSILESRFLAAQIDLEIQLMRALLGMSEEAEEADKGLAAEKGLAVYLSETQVAMLRNFMQSPKGADTLRKYQITNEQQALLLEYLDLNLVTDDLHRRSTLKTIDYLLHKSLKPILGTDKKIEEVFRIDEIFLKGALDASDSMRRENKLKDTRSIEKLTSLLDEVAQGSDDKAEVAAMASRVRTKVLEAIQGTLEEKIKAWSDESLYDCNLYTLKPELWRLFAEERADQRDLLTQDEIRSFEFEGDIRDKAVHSFDQMAHFQRRQFDFYRDLLWNVNRLPLHSFSGQKMKENFHTFSPDGYSWQLFLNKAAEPIRRMLNSKQLRDLSPDINEDGIEDDASQWTERQARIAQKKQEERSAEAVSERKVEAAAGKGAAAAGKGAAVDAGDADDGKAAETEVTDVFSNKKVEEENIQKEMEYILEQFAYQKVMKIVKQEVYQKVLAKLYPFSKALTMDQFQKLIVELNLVRNCWMHAEVSSIGLFKDDEVQFGVRLGGNGSVYLGHFKDSLYHGPGILFEPKCRSTRANFVFLVQMPGSSEFQTLSEKDLVTFVAQKTTNQSQGIRTLRVMRVDPTFDSEMVWWATEGREEAPDESAEEKQARKWKTMENLQNAAWNAQWMPHEDCKVFETAKKLAPVSFWDQLTMAGGAGGRESMAGIYDTHDVSFLGLMVAKVGVNFPYTCYTGQWEKGEFLKTEKPAEEVREKQDLAFVDLDEDLEGDDEGRGNSDHLLRSLPFWVAEKPGVLAGLPVAKVSQRDIPKGAIDHKDTLRSVEHLPTSEQEKLVTSQANISLVDSKHGANW